MPRLSRLTNESLARLAEELRFAPPPALERDIARAEDLAAELDPEQWYPEDWVVFRITGYRPELDEPATILGSALLADLSAFVERLSEPAKPDADAPGLIALDDLCARWGVSARTIARMRKTGLIARRARTKAGQPVLVFREEVVDRFERANPDRLARAGTFTRIDPETTARIESLARRARARFAWSLNQSAERIAPRVGRSREGVRQVLLRVERRTPAFDVSAPMGERERHAAWRAWRRGVPVRELETRWGRTRTQLRRAIDLERAHILASFDLSVPPSPRLDRADAERLLEPEPVRTDLVEAVETDLLAFIERARTPIVPVGVEETARAAASAYLRRRAARTIGDLGAPSPLAERLDRAETDLRWAHRLVAALVRTQLHVVVETLEGGLGLPLDRMRAPEALALVRAALESVGRETLRHDPWKGGRLAARATVAATRLVADWAHTHDPSRATPRLAPGTGLGDWQRVLTPWGSLLFPAPRALANTEGLSEHERSVLTLRYGLDGTPPRTLTETTDTLGLYRIQTPRIEQRAVRRARTSV